MEFPHYKNETVAIKESVTYDPEAELTGIERMAKFAKSFSAKKGRKIMTDDVTNYEATWFVNNAEKYPYDDFYILTEYDDKKLNVVDLIHASDAEDMFPKIGTLYKIPLSPDRNHLAIKHLFRNVRNVHVVRPEIPGICTYLKKNDSTKSQ